MEIHPSKNMFLNDKRSKRFIQVLQYLHGCFKMSKIHNLETCTFLKITIQSRLRNQILLLINNSAATCKTYALRIAEHRKPKHTPHLHLELHARKGQPRKNSPVMFAQVNSKTNNYINNTQLIRFWLRVNYTK